MKPRRGHVSIDGAIHAASRRRCRSLGYSMAEKLTELLADLPPTPQEVELTTIAADEGFAKGERP